jgi:superfamily II DNA or RNA helicase
MYTFITYGTFVNRVLGIKEYKKNELGESTNEELGRRKAVDPITNFSNCVIIIDEAHNVTNNEIYTALYQVLGNSYNTRLVLLTATPIYDNCREIFELTNLLNRKAELPIRNELIRQDYISRINSGYINETILKGGIVFPTQKGLDSIAEALKGRVSWVPQNRESFPVRRDIGRELIPGRKGTTTVVYCQMSEWQYRGYSKALLEDSESSLYKNASDAATIVYPQNPGPLQDGDLNKLGETESGTLIGKEGFLSVFKKRGSEWIPKDGYQNFLKPENLNKVAVKLARLIQYLSQSKGPAFVYSNYVNYGGTALIALTLKANGYTQVSLGSNFKLNPGRNFIMYEDTLDAETRDSIRKVFNSKENRYGDLIKIFVGSPIASEGITLKAVRQVHILEPTWNMSKLEQIIGRAIRNYSHEHLPLEDRKVDIFKYTAVFSNPEFQEPKFFIDRQKYLICEEKDRANKIMERRLKEIAIDCRFSVLENQNNDNSAVCDYRECNVACQIAEYTQKLDTKTFKKHIDFFAKDDIKWLMSWIQSGLFKKQLLWHFNDIYTRTLTDAVGKQGTFDKETVLFALIQAVTNQTKITDLYGRSGTIVKRGSWFIFNRDGLDLNTSSFMKAFDFSEQRDTKPLTFPEWVESTSGKLKKEKEKEKEKKKSIQDLTAEERDYNQKIVDNSVIYGTFYSRFGEKDDIFRIVDKRKMTQEELIDKRKQLTGMSCDSFSKKELVDLVKYLSPEQNFKDKKEMCTFIYNYLKETNQITL